jgi:5-(carboxyamino)imidazole ribonucleotide synthase
MMALAAGPLHLPYHTLDQDESFPAAPYSTRFVAGDFRSEADVLAFGRQVDVLTIEIEHVHTGALHQLQAEGVIVHPDPSVLDIIKDKGLQKLFYQSHELPTSDFDLYPDEASIRAAVSSEELQLPFVQKARTGGYDGRGVVLIRDAEDLQTKLLPGASLVEQLVDIEKELAVIVARNERGQIKSFPVVEMVFDPEANLVDYLLGPAQIPPAVAAEATLIAEATATAFNVCGLLAVELFLTKAGTILINEVAPRPHNSGHHTIESCVTSQFAQHLRAVLNLPLGDTRLHGFGAMLNILGEPGYTGPVHYEGLDQALALPGVYAHLYGKTETRPFRKMGHFTVVGQELAEVQETIQQLKATVKCISQS